MSLPSDTSHISDPPEPSPSAMTEPRPLYWSVRRELWENRSIYVAPLAVTAIVLFATLFSMFGLPHKFRTLASMEPSERHLAVVEPLCMAPAPIMLATILVGLFYSLDALYGERRDRSLLFWKSLPVSDRTTVLSKASIPLVVLPLIGFVLSLAAVAVVLVMSTLVLLVNGMSPAPLWLEARFFQQPVIMLYGLVVHALWFAPIYGWLLLISAWARRLPLLWVALPPVAIAVVEHITSSTNHFASLLGYRVSGAMEEAFAVTPQGSRSGNIDALTQLDPGRFLLSPGLWVGLLFAAGCLVLAVRLRRYREPL